VLAWGFAAQDSPRREREVGSRGFGVRVGCGRGLGRPPRACEEVGVGSHLCDTRLDLRGEYASHEIGDEGWEVDLVGDRAGRDLGDDDLEVSGEPGARGVVEGGEGG
jgi:hypothetical protein